MALQLLVRLFTSQPRLPTFDELSPFHDMPGCGWIWGEDDQLGTVNLLSDKLVQRACLEEVQYVGGEGSLCYRFSTRWFPQDWEVIIPQLVRPPIFFHLADKLTRLRIGR